MKLQFHTEETLVSYGRNSSAIGVKLQCRTGGTEDSQSHAELLERGGLYAQLYQIQFKE